MKQKMTAWILILSMLFTCLGALPLQVQAAKSTVLVSVDNSEIVTYYGGTQGQILEITKEYIDKMGKNTYQTYPKRGDGFQKDTPGALSTSYCEEDVGLFRQDIVMCNLEQLDAYLLKNYGTDYTGNEMEGYLHYLQQNFTRCHGLVTYSCSLGEEWTDALLKTCTYNGVTYYYVTEADVSQIGDHYLIPNQQFFRAGTLVGDYFFEIEVTWTGGTFGLPYSLEECVSYILSRVQFNFENSGECLIDPDVRTGSEDPTIVSTSPASGSSGEQMCSEISIAFDRRIRSINLSTTNFYILDQETGELAYKADTSRYALGQASFDKNVLTLCIPNSDRESPFLAGHTYYLVLDWGAVTFVDDTTLVITDPEVWNFTVEETEPESVQNVEYTYSCSLTGEEASGTITYDDRYFAEENGSLTYNSDLAAASMALALAAAPHLETKTNALTQTETTDYSKAYKNAEDLLKTLGFSNTSHTASYTSKQQDAAAAAVFGKKKLSDGTTLIAVAVRSESNAAEWADNFNIGESTMNHAGYETARQDLLTALAKYIKDKKITGEVTIWLTGYGRGGAIVNLAAASLNNIGSMEGVTFEQKNVYAYTFEAPASTTDTTAASESYSNVYNVIDPYDVTELFPCTQWGFTRYGQTFYLPTVSEGRTYQTYIQKVREEYIRLTGTSQVPGTDSLQTTYFQGQVQRVEELIKEIYRLSSGRSGFCSLLEPILSSHVETLLESEPGLNYGTLLGTMVLAAKNGKKSEAEANYTALLSQILENGADAAYHEKAPYVQTLIQNRDLLKLVGSAEWMLSWMNTLAGTGILEQTASRIDEDTDPSGLDYCDMQIKLEAAADIEIYDACDNLIAAIYNSGSTYVASGAPAEAWVYDQAKYFLLPKDGTYRIVMQAVEQDTANLKVTLMTYGKSDWTEETSYDSLLMEYGERAYTINIRPDAYSNFCSVSVKTPSGEILQESGWRSTYSGYTPSAG